MKSAPAVSQLAGKIAEKISRLATSTHEACSCVDILRANITRLGTEAISVALAEREEKAKRLKLAAWNLLSVLPKSSALVERVGKFSAELETALADMD